MKFILKEEEERREDYKTTEGRKIKIEQNTRINQHMKVTGEIII